MAAAKPCVTKPGELVRKFSHYSAIAQDAPVVITKNGQPRNVLISVKEFERLKIRDQQAFLAADTPEQFLADIEARKVEPSPAGALGHPHISETELIPMTCRNQPESRIGCNASFETALRASSG